MMIAQRLQHVEQPLVKQSDINHNSAGVKKQLHAIERNFKELSKDKISYLHRCFICAVTQNRGNSQSMADVLRSISHHTFNDHSLFANWCGYIQDKETYDHKIVPGGFQDPNLFNELKDIFYK